ncbi:MAG: hypothetical protein IJI68_11375 [Eggerthellaceae bacterium]|nr:hypothetical protein [Eggerthellaceae bacterium]
MHILVGALAGFLGFLPLVGSANMARSHPSTGTLSFGLYALGGVAISLAILIVSVVACAMVARDGLVAFVVAEGIVFLGATIVYVLRRNSILKRGQK